MRCPQTNYFHSWIKIFGTWNRSFNSIPKKLGQWQILQQNRYNSSDITLQTKDPINSPEAHLRFFLPSQIIPTGCLSENCEKLSIYAKPSETFSFWKKKKSLWPYCRVLTGCQTFETNLHNFHWQLVTWYCARLFEDNLWGSSIQKFVTHFPKWMDG